MIIRNGKVYSANCIFEERDIVISGEKIVSHELAMTNDTEVIDATDMYVIPGLIDIHLHGCVGEDFSRCDADTIQRMVDYQISHGITSIVPASMTLPEDELMKAFEVIALFCNRGDASIAGINMEGPFISDKKKGAQKKDYILDPDTDMFERLYKVSNGLIKLIDIAPEKNGAMDFIKSVKDKVHISLAHTDCDYETAMEAFNNGADHVTHLYNAMNEFSHRSPGVLGAITDCGKVYGEIIADGIHNHPSAVRMAEKVLGSERLIFISDSMEACGMPDGEYALGGQPVIKKGSVAVIKGTDTIAGSVMNLMDMFRNAVLNMNIPMERALKYVTLNPAKSIGIDSGVGSLENGKYADIVLLDKNLEVVKVIKHGRICFSAFY